MQQDNKLEHTKFLDGTLLTKLDDIRDSYDFIRTCFFFFFPSSRVQTINELVSNCFFVRRATR